MGESNGNIGAYNYSNGCKMKDFSQHDSEVAAVVYLPSLKYVLSCGWDRYIVLHDESDPGEMNIQLLVYLMIVDVVSCGKSFFIAHTSIFHHL